MFPQTTEGLWTVIRKSRGMWSAWWKYNEYILEIIEFTCFVNFFRFDIKGIGKKKTLVKSVAVVVAIRNDVCGNTINEDCNDNTEDTCL